MIQHWYKEQCNGPTGSVVKMSHRQLLKIAKLLKDINATFGSIKFDITLLVPTPDLGSEK